MLLAGQAVFGAASYNVSAGNVYHIDLDVVQEASYWAAFYGQAEAGGVQTLDAGAVNPATGTRVTREAVRYAPPCAPLTPWLVFSTSAIIQWSGFAPADLTAVNALSGVSNTSRESAINTFLNISDLFFGGSTILQVPMIELYPEEAGFEEYVLSDGSGHLIFVVPVFDGKNGFNGEPVNYQVILPAGPTYYVHVPPFLCPTSRSAMPPVQEKEQDAKPAPDKPPMDGQPDDAKKEQPMEPILEVLKQFPKNDEHGIILDGEQQEGGTMIEEQTMEVQEVGIREVLNPEARILASSGSALVTVQTTGETTRVTVVTVTQTSGLQVIWTVLPYTFEEIRNGNVRVDFKRIKREPKAKAAGDWLAELGFDSSVANYRVVNLGGSVRLEWRMEAEKGEAFAIIANLKETTEEKLRQIRVGQFKETRPKAQSTAQTPSAQLRVWTEQSVRAGFSVLTVLAALLTAVAAVALWKKPWIRWYLKPGQWEYLYYYVRHRREHH